MRWLFGIATNIKGQFLIADYSDESVNVFDSNGKFDFRFKPQTDDTDTKLYVLDVAAGEDEKISLPGRINLYPPCSLLVEEAGAEEWREVQVFNKTADLEHKFPVRSGDSRWYDDRLTVTSGKQGSKILLKTTVRGTVRESLKGRVVDVHEPSGEFVCVSMLLSNASDMRIRT